MDALTPTPAQVRKLQAEFWYLGYSGGRDRDARLAAAAEALGLDELKSFNDLRAGQAGYLMGCLRRQEVPGLDELRGREGVIVAVRPSTGADEMAVRILGATMLGWCAAAALLLILECRATIRAVRLAVRIDRANGI